MVFGLFTSQHAKAVAFKREERMDRIDALPAYKDPITTAERGILNAPAAEIVNKIQARELKPRDVLLAYGKRALEAQAHTNCLTEIMISEAEKWADEVDTSKPLAGFPVSLKDSAAVKGYDVTLGYSKWVNQPSAIDSPLVRLLRDAGAIPFVKTNIPLTLLSFEAYNDVWGTTTNPHNRDYSPGGSSGGESALLAWGGSRLGIGTDVAGSVRVPAHFSGCYSLRCSTTRFPKARNPTTLVGQEGIPGVYSPMTRTLDDLRFFFEQIIRMKPWKYDHMVAPIAWRDVVLPKKLRVGVLWDDGVVTPSPACRRALELTVDALEKQGHEIVAFTAPRPFDALRIASRLLVADAGKVATRGMLRGEHNDAGFGRALSYARLPRWVRRIYGWWVRYVRRDSVWADLIDGFGEQTVPEQWALVGEREDYKSKFYDAWQAADIDVLLTVPNATPAFPHRGLYDSFSSCGYTFLFNLLDYPAGILPVTKVDRAQDALPSDFKLSKLNGVAQGAYVHYDVDRLHGLPVGVQVVGPKLEEETVLAAMKVAEDALKAQGIVYPLLNT